LALTRSGDISGAFIMYHNTKEGAFKNFIYPFIISSMLYCDLPAFKALGESQYNDIVNNISDMLNEK
jgi:hypothetical protein